MTMRDKIARAISDPVSLEDCSPWYRKDLLDMADRVLALIAPVMEENEALKHDLERQMTIANIECNEAERLRSALEPFAAMAEYLDDTAKRRDAIYCGGSPGLRCEITQADYHKARAALSPSEKHDG
jgi:hypothetical protein